MNAKRYVSVICEYNPFHFGHEYQLNELKREFDGIICIQSGDIVQRGSVAVADKYLRAEAALKSGADLVLELPMPWCCSSARDFATAGVHIAHSIKSTHLAFGAENSIDILLKVKEASNLPDFAKSVAEIVEKSENKSYPQAFCEVIENELGKDISEAMKKPNNILALEYLNALDGTRIVPFAVKRNQGFMSSSQIRQTGNGKDMLSLLPEASKSVFARENGKLFPRDAKRLDSFFIGTLRRIASSSNIPKNIYSAPDDLLQKILAQSVKTDSVDSLVGSVSDKIYTHARVRRAINSLVFGITRERVSSMPTYTCVLAANSVGREILKNAKGNENFDIITKPVHALSKRDETKNAFLFSKSIEDVITLSSLECAPADSGRVPFIL